MATQWMLMFDDRPAPLLRRRCPAWLAHLVLCAGIAAMPLAYAAQGFDKSVSDELAAANGPVHTDLPVQVQTLPDAPVAVAAAVSVDGLRATLLEERRDQPEPVLSATAQRVVRFFETVPGAKAIEQHLRSASALHGVDYYLMQALIATESGFNPRARSHRGAVGLMQVMPSTAVRMGLVADKGRPVHRKLQDPQTNIHYGTKYFATIQSMFSGRIDLALAAYNAGEGAVQRAGNQVPNYKETRSFVRKVTEIYDSLKARASAPSPSHALLAAPLDGPLADTPEF